MAAIDFTPVDRLSSWGRLTAAPHRVARPRFRDQLPGVVASLSSADPGLAIGLRRAYGDSNLNPGGRVIDMTGLDRLIAFDRETGIVRAEAGASLSQIIAVLAPAGWFPATTPGTRFVTLGGAVANDVHGKNHHAVGSFGNWVTRMMIHRSDGPPREVAIGDPLFHATVGGLGLTGLIEWVEFQATPIDSTWLEAEETSFESLDGYFELSDTRRASFEHTLAWIDCLAHGDNLGRGVFSSANWAATGGLRLHAASPRLSAPFGAPGFAFNRMTIGALNTLYHGAKSMSGGRKRVHYSGFLYPLDGVAHWNRLYGGRGFYQYQCVIPKSEARAALTDILSLVAKSGQGSFPAVLKDFGDIAPVGLISFPMEGVTLAIDFPNKGSRTTSLFSELDAIVSSAGGRIYPAKDARAAARMFRDSYPGWEGFGAYVDPAFRSAFWERVSS
ncbi:FAD-binding protein [bacterium]|nr:FAD-binding protein [bacterium]